MNKDIDSLIFERLDLSRNLTGEEILERIDSELQAESRLRAMTIDEKKEHRKNIYNRIRKLGILQDFLDDPGITEIMVNGIENIFIERGGNLFRVPEKFDSVQNLRQVIWQITSECNRVVNDSSPIVDARLPDGSRVNVVLDPVAINGPILTIRRFPERPIDIDDLYRFGSLTREAGLFLKEAVERGDNILVSGGTGTGKTTFLNVLSNFIPATQRVITIEDSAELRLTKVTNLVRLETRNANVEGCREITIRDLLKTSLRMRPDRIIVGEVRSFETIDMLQSVNVGHSAMTTVHANSVRDVVSRLETMFLMGMEMPVSAIRAQIASGFDLMIHLARCEDGKRCVKEIAQPAGIENGQIIMNSLFLRTDKALKKVGTRIENKKRS